MIARRSRRVPVLARMTNRSLAPVLAASLVFGAAVAVAAVKAGKYVGTNSETRPITLTIAPGGRKITHFNTILAYNGKCGPGGGPGLTAAPSSMTIKPNGSFSQNVTLSLTGIANPIHDPGRVFGKVSGSKVTGTVEQFLHGAVNRCYIETFTARRR